MNTVNPKLMLALIWNNYNSYNFESYIHFQNMGWEWQYKEKEF